MYLPLHEKSDKTDQMKRIIQSLCMLLLSSAVLTSCLSDDDSSGESYSDTAITAVTLGTLNRYTQTVSSKTGNDTIIKTTLTGSNYKLTIDQLGRTIGNLDSLPLGTDLKHVVISSLSTKNSGTALIKSLISDTLFYVRTTDSLDFTQPRLLRVLAANGADYRDYTMTLTASTTTGTTFGWQKVRQDSGLAGWTDKKLVAVGDSEKLVEKGVIAVDSVLFETNTPTLLGATEHEIIAMDDNGRLITNNKRLGIRWREEQLDDSPALLPTSAMAMTSWKYFPADSTDCILLAGNSDADAVNAVCWRKLSRTVGTDTEGTWVYMPVDGYNRYALPRQEYLSMTYYNNNVLAVGSNMKLYMSRDQGITWKTQTIYALPAQIGGTRATIAADKRERLWLVTDTGELWMGTLR